MPTASTSYGTLSDTLDGAYVEDAESTRNRLSTFQGVFVPCCLNIMGVVLFLRLGWAVGQAGILPVLGMFAVGEVQTVLTVLSLTAIVTNGRMKGGGAYYVISRSIGPALGGAIGLLFYIAYSISCAFYTIGVAGELKAVFWPGNDSPGLILLLCSATLACLLAISLMGAHGYAKINIVLLVLQMVGVYYGLANFIFGAYIGSAPRELPSGGRFEGSDVSQMGKNLWSAYDSESKDKPWGTPSCVGATFQSASCNWPRVFGVIFPAVTGIMEGANLSGDLESPEKAIGIGTLSAIAFSASTYVALILSMGSAFNRQALQLNAVAFQESVSLPGIVEQAILVSAFSSGLQAMFGGARIVQALARDRLFPFLSYFAEGSRVGNEPRRAIVLTWAIAQLVCLNGAMDTVASAVTCCFCCTYGLVNLSCLLLHLSGTPNFRPSFTWTSWRTAFIGAVLNIGMALFVHPLSSFALLVLLALSCFYVARWGPTKGNWGDVSQALVFHQARKWLLQLDERHSHPKNWRPSLLLLASSVDVDVLHWCNRMKKGGLFCVSEIIVVQSDRNENLNIEAVGSAKQCRAKWLDIFARESLKAVPQINISRSTREGLQSVMISHGVGAFMCNTIVLSLKAGEAAGESDMLDANTLCGVLNDAALLRKNALVVSATAHGRALSNCAKFITIFHFAGTGSVFDVGGGIPGRYLRYALLLAHIVRNKARPTAGRGLPKIRVIVIAHSGGLAHSEQAVHNTARETRIECEVIGHEMDATMTLTHDLRASCDVVREALCAFCAPQDSLQTFLPLPPNAQDCSNLRDSQVFVDNLRSLAACTADVAFVSAGEIGDQVNVTIGTPTTAKKALL